MTQKKGEIRSPLLSKKNLIRRKRHIKYSNSKSFHPFRGGE
nr:MAG TPA: hypothetical protein [Caudoviricetes sp.]